MQFKKLNVDGLALMADLISREANDRDPMLAGALRRIEIVENGRYGEGRPDVRLTLALATGVEASIDARWRDQAATLAMLVDSVEELVSSAARIFDDRHDTIDLLKEVRATLSKEISKARRRGLQHRTLDVSLTASESGSHDLPTAVIGIEVLGPLLDAERAEFLVESGDDVRKVFADMRERQDDRLAMRDHLASLGADVMIDAVTLEALYDAGLDPADALADLRGSRIGIVDVEVRHGKMPFYVRDCVVTGNVPLGDGMHWQEGRLSIPKDRGIPASKAKGKSVTKLVDHPLLADIGKVTYATEAGHVLWLHAEPKVTPLRLEQRRKAA